MKGQRSIWLALAGLVLVGLVWWWSTQSNEPGNSAPPAPVAKSSTNLLARVGATNARPASSIAPTNRPVRPSPARASVASPARTNLQAGAVTNIAAGKGAVVKAPPAGAVTTTNKVSSFSARFAEWRKSPAFYPALAAIPLALGVLFLWLASRSGKGKAKQGPGGTTRVAGAKAKRRAGAAVQHCNVLETAPDARKLWAFAARGGGFALTRDHKSAPGESLPGSVIEKDWRTLFQRKLNVAWLPAEQVFMRVLHLPQANLDETLQMVEFQLEKLSPMPVAQVVWSIQQMPDAEENQQTIVVLIVARSIVEEFLGRLENEGYLADRLEIPQIDQLLATNAAESNGAWIYPMVGNAAGSALVAWFYGGVLRNVDLVTPATEDKAKTLGDQLVQMAWAGELEGWLTAPPEWHLVADAATASEWEPLLSQALDQPVKVSPAQPPTETAASTALRAAQADPAIGLLPSEYSVKYQQQFVDRLWMRALGAVVVLYLIGVGIYLVAVQVAAFRTRAVENEVAKWGPTYTNALQLKAQYEVLKDRQELKFAALDCWKAVAELLPETLQLEAFSFTDGRRLLLQGTAPMGQVQQIYQFEGALRKVLVSGRPLFDPIKGETPNYHTAPGGAGMSWSFALELKRTEVQ